MQPIRMAMHPMAFVAKSINHDRFSISYCLNLLNSISNFNDHVDFICQRNTQLLQIFAGKQETVAHFIRLHREIAHDVDLPIESLHLPHRVQTKTSD